MFNPSKKTAANKPVKKEPTRDYAVTILTNGGHFTGKLYCKGSTRIGGRIDGEIISEGLLILEEEAVVNADIQADEIVVQGKVHGTVKAHSRVELSSSCTFSGDVASPSLVIEEGARFNGRSTMDPEAMPQPQQLKSDIKHHANGKQELRGEVKVDEKDAVKDVALKVPEINANA
ncbi:MAG: bactofilin family protein [Oligoflexus sp.]